MYGYLHEALSPFLPNGPPLLEEMPLISQGLPYGILNDLFQYLPQGLSVLHYRVQGPIIQDFQQQPWQVDGDADSILAFTEIDGSLIVPIAHLLIDTGNVNS